MKTVKVIIERNDNGNYQAVPQINENIAFFGMGKNLAEAMVDLYNSYDEAKIIDPGLPDMAFEYESSSEEAKYCYAVIARRFGDMEKHSYLVGVYNDYDLAVESAECETTWRGGKYKCYVHKCNIKDRWNTNNHHEIVFETK